MRRPLIALTAVAASGTLALSACAGGSSDVVAQPGSTAAGAATTSTIGEPSMSTGRASTRLVPPSEGMSIWNRAPDPMWDS